MENTTEKTQIIELNNSNSETNLSSYGQKMINNDIKYRGPLSYRHFRLFGWLSLSIMFISMMLILSFSFKTSAVTPQDLVKYERISSIMSYFSSLPLPLFLIANFAVILQQRNNYKRLIMKYGIILLIIYVLFVGFYYHYTVLVIMRLNNVSFIEARRLSIDIYTILGKQSGLVVNIFVDLFCCVLIMFFIDYTPKKYFQGKKIIIFRLFALLPIIYEIGSAVLMGFLGMNQYIPEFSFSLPPEILPLIGKKPVGMIISFALICLYIKFREIIFKKKGGNKEEFELYLKTNRSSLHFSIVMSVIFTIVAIIDLLSFLIPVMGYESLYGTAEAENLSNILSSFTVGKSICLFLVIPLIMLFSYNKQYKNKKIDILIPVIGIFVVLFSSVETLFFTLLF